MKRLSSSSKIYVSDSKIKNADRGVFATEKIKKNVIFCHETTQLIRKKLKSE